MTLFKRNIDLFCFSKPIQKHLFLLAFLLFAAVHLQAQSKAEIQNVDFSMIANKLVVTYDIAKSGKGETFKVSMLIKTSSGKTIYPKALAGDINENVSGGTGKRIEWDMLKDLAFLDEEIKVFLTVEPQKAPVMVLKKTDVKNPVLHSLIFPGWGNWQITAHKSYFILGGAAWSFAAGAFIMNQVNIGKYNDYLNTKTEKLRNIRYSTVETNNKITIGLIAAAGTIWIGDLVLTLVQKNKYVAPKGLSTGFIYDPRSKAPVLSLTYKF